MSLLDAFKKKDSSDAPDVSDMVKSGMSEQDIIDSLKQQGYDNSAIKAALINSNIDKEGDTGHDLSKESPDQDARASQNTQSSMPSMQPQMTMQYPSSQPQQSLSPRPDLGKGLTSQTMDTIQGILEQVVEEKWQSAASDLNTIKTKSKANEDIISGVGDRVDKLNQRIDLMQGAMAGKADEFNKTLMDVNIELQAFEKVIDKLIPAITDSVKELRDLIEDLKKNK